MKVMLNLNWAHLFKAVNLKLCCAVVKRRIQDRELAIIVGSISVSTKCCILQLETLSTLLCTGFYPGKSERNTWVMRVSHYIKKLN